MQRLVKNLKYSVNLEGISRRLSKIYGSSVVYSITRDKVEGRTSELRVKRGRANKEGGGERHRDRQTIKHSQKATWKYRQTDS